MRKGASPPKTRMRSGSAAAARPPRPARNGAPVRQASAGRIVDVDVRVLVAQKRTSARRAPTRARGRRRRPGDRAPSAARWRSSRRWPRIVDLVHVDRIALGAAERVDAPFSTARRQRAARRRHRHAGLPGAARLVPFHTSPTGKQHLDRPRVAARARYTMRRRHCSVTASSCIGGYHGRPVRGSRSATCGNGTRRAAPGSPACRCRRRAARWRRPCLNGRITALGGAQRDPVNVHEIYDPAANAWKTAQRAADGARSPGRRRLPRARVGARRALVVSGQPVRERRHLRSCRRRLAHRRAVAARPRRPGRRRAARPHPRLRRRGALPHLRATEMYEAGGRPLDRHDADADAASRHRRRRDRRAGLHTGGGREPGSRRPPSTRPTRREDNARAAASCWSRVRPWRGRARTRWPASPTARCGGRGAARS